MIKQILISTILFVVSYSLSAQKRIGDWQTYLPYNYASCLAQKGNVIFVGTQTAMFSYDKTDGSVQTYDRTNGLSDMNISCLAYSPKNDVLIIAYSNSLLDLFTNGKATPIYDISKASILGSKTINNVFVKGDTAYISCDFGMVLFDIVKREVRDTYIIGNNGNNIATYGVALSPQQIAIATEEGLKIANANNANLANFNNWQTINALPMGTAKKVVYWNNRFYALIGNKIWTYDSNNNTLLVYTAQTNWAIKNMEISNNKMLLCEYQNNSSATRVLTFDETLQNPASVSIWDMNYPTQALLDETNNMWVADDKKGLYRIISPDYGEVVVPNGPVSTRVMGLATDKNDNLWLTAGNVNQSYNTLSIRDGISMYANNTWTSYNENNIPLMNDALDLLTVLPNPYQNEIYFSSYGGGLLQYDYTNFTLYNETNSLLRTPSGNSGACLTNGLVFDNEANLWIVNSGVDKPIVVKKTDGNWLSFKPNISLTSDRLKTILIDDYNQKWVVVFRGGILVMDSGADLNSTADDRYKNLKLGAGQGNLPSNDVTCLVKDKDGYIWVGTSNGIGIYYCPYAVFDNGCDAEKPYVEIDGYGAYLLENEIVNCIAVDGANRKWIGTENGLFVVSPDGTKTIHYFTTANTPLLSNVILSLMIDGKKGEVYIGTDQGLMSYKTDALEATNVHTDVLVYPNPVRPDYSGNIMVKGLAYNSSVKITNISGNVVYEGAALGSQLIWDGNDHTGKRVRSGVYLVFSSNNDNTDHYVTKFVVVN